MTDIERNSHKSSWFPLALTTFAMFGVTNFLLTLISHNTPQELRSAASVTAAMLVWAGMGVMGLVAALYFKISGRGFSGIPSQKFAFLSGAAGITLALGMLTLKIGLAADPESAGPIVAMTAANSVIVATFSWLALKEKLGRAQILGMVMALSGVAFMALSSTSEASVRGVLFGLATMLLFGITNSTLKYVGHHGTNSITASVVLWLSAGAFGAASILASFGVGRGVAGLEGTSLAYVAFAAGLFLGVGMLTIKTAVTRGPAGPATAIAGSNALLVTLLALTFLNIAPATNKIVGMFVVIAGIVVLSRKPTKTG